MKRPFIQWNTKLLIIKLSPSVVVTIPVRRKQIINVGNNRKTPMYFSILMQEAARTMMKEKNEKNKKIPYDTNDMSRPNICLCHQEWLMTKTWRQPSNGPQIHMAICLDRDTNLGY